MFMQHLVDPAGEDLSLLALDMAVQENNKLSSYSAPHFLRRSEGGPQPWPVHRSQHLPWPFPHRLNWWEAYLEPETVTQSPAL